MDKRCTNKYSQGYYYACEPCRKLHAACDDQEICGTCLVNGTEHECYRAQRKLSSASRKKALKSEAFHDQVGYDMWPKFNTQDTDQDLIIIPFHEGSVSESINETTILWPEKFYEEHWADSLSKKMVWNTDEAGNIKDEVPRTSIKRPCFNDMSCTTVGDLGDFPFEHHGKAENHMDTSECIKKSLSVIAKQPDEQWLDTILKEEPPY